jgi:hypothetical protein
MREAGDGREDHYDISLEAVLYSPVGKTRLQAEDRICFDCGPGTDCIPGSIRRRIKVP